jgi:hypothetical protein
MTFQVIFPKKQRVLLTEVFKKTFRENFKYGFLKNILSTSSYNKFVEKFF